MTRPKIDLNRKEECYLSEAGKASMESLFERGITDADLAFELTIMLLGEDKALQLENQELEGGDDEV